MLCTINYVPFCHVIDLNLVLMLFLARVGVSNHFSIKTGTHGIFRQYSLAAAEFGNLIHNVVFHS